MHGIAEQIRVMNQINTHLVQYLAITNPPPTTTTVPEVVDWSRPSRRSSNHDSQSRKSIDQAYSTKSHRYRSPSLHSRWVRSHATSESRSSSWTHDTGGEESKRRGRSPRRDDQMHKRRDKCTTRKIKDLDARIDAINTSANAPVIVDPLIRQTKPPFTDRVMRVMVSSRFKLPSQLRV